MNQKHKQTSPPWVPLVSDEELERRFATHEAHYDCFETEDLGRGQPGTRRKSSLEMLRWARKDGSGDHYVKYVMHHGTLLVSGDLGDAIHSWHHSIGGLAGVAGCDFGYYMSKMRASGDGRDGKTWNEKKAHKRLLDFYAELACDDWHDASDDLPRSLLDIQVGSRIARERVNGLSGVGYVDPLACICTQADWHEFIANHGHALFGDDYCEWADAGMEPNWTYRAHWLGLKMAMDKVKGLQAPSAE